MAKDLGGVVFNDYSKEVLDALEGQALKAMKRIGMQAEGYAADLAPVGTPESTGIPGYIGGTLRNSITHALAGEPPDKSSYSDNSGRGKGKYSGVAPKSSDFRVYIGTNVEYSEIVELGTSKMPARPYLKPAISGHAQTYRNIIEDELKNG